MAKNLKTTDDFKTNVMRLLEQAEIAYKPHSYADSDALSGREVAEFLGEDPSKVFKTLVTVGRSKKNYVFVIPVLCELDLKKAAASVGEKSIEMIKEKELFPLTGYVHGGCSPIGMRKQFVTVIDESVLLTDTFYFSAGKIGFQVELSHGELSRIIPFKTAELTV